MAGLTAGEEDQERLLRAAAVLRSLADREEWLAGERLPAGVSMIF
jgi:hypothetical protein